MIMIIQLPPLLAQCIVFSFYLSISKYFVSASCQPPDVPVGGNIEPFKEYYELGDEVVYNCYDSFRIGDKVRLCDNNGHWSGATPFCDVPTKLKNPSGSSISTPANDANQAIDGNVYKCFSTKRGTGQFFQVYLDTPAVVNVIRLYLHKGQVKINVCLSRKRTKKSCVMFNRQLEDQQWALIEMEDSQTSDSIHISDISDAQSVLEICEIQVYVRSAGYWCKDPPDIMIPSGWLEISRSKASLKCARGYKPGKNTRLVCDSRQKWIGSLLQCTEIVCESTLSDASGGGEWHLSSSNGKFSVGSKKKLRCYRGYEILGAPSTVTCLINGTWSKTNATCAERESKNDKGGGMNKTIIIVSVVIVLILLACFGIVLFVVLKKKSKPVVVVLKPNESTGEYTMKSTRSNNTEYSEAEYSTVAYEAISRQKPTPPPPSKPPTNLLDSYSQPIDQWSTSRGYTNIENSPYIDPMGSFRKNANNKPVDIVFDTLKHSSMYGT